MVRFGGTLLDEGAAPAETKYYGFFAALPEALPDALTEWSVREFRASTALALLIEPLLPMVLTVPLLAPVRLVAVLDFDALGDAGVFVGTTSPMGAESCATVDAADAEACFSAWATG